MKQAYIGTKIIIAEPMDEKTFFLTIRPGPGSIWFGGSRPGFSVYYEDGYISWSPRETFERAYRLVTPEESELLKS